MFAEWINGVAKVLGFLFLTIKLPYFLQWKSSLDVLPSFSFHFITSFPLQPVSSSTFPEFLDDSPVCVLAIQSCFHSLNALTLTLPFNLILSPSLGSLFSSQCLPDDYTRFEGINGVGVNNQLQHDTTFSESLPSLLFYSQHTNPSRDLTISCLEQCTGIPSALPSSTLSFLHMTN